MIHSLYNQVMGFKKGLGGVSLNNNVWMESFHDRNQGDEEVSPNCSLRTPLPHILWHIGDEIRHADYLLRSGNRIRVKFGSGTGRFKVDHASIVEMDATGSDEYIMFSTSKGVRKPTELKFSGKSGFSLEAGYKTITSDPLHFELDRTKCYIVIMDVSDGSSSYFPIARTGGIGGYKADNTNSWDDETADFYRYYNTRCVGVTQVEVYTDDAYNLDIYNATCLNYNYQGWIKKYYGSKSRLIIPESQYGLELQQILSNAFTNTSLKYIQVPATVTAIGMQSFSSPNLEQVHFNGNAPSYNYEEGIPFGDCAENFHITYNSGATGFSTPTWMGKPCAPIE